MNWTQLWSVKIFLESWLRMSRALTSILKLICHFTWVSHHSSKPHFLSTYIFCFSCLVKNGFWSCSKRGVFQNEFCDHNGFSGSLLKIHRSREHQSDARTAWRPASDWVSANHQRSSFAPGGGGCRQTPLAAHFTQQSSLLGEYHKSDKILGVCMNLGECHLGNLGQESARKVQFF